MLPSGLLENVAEVIASVDGVGEVITYAPTGTEEPLIVNTVWVDLETMQQRLPSTDDEWDALANYKITVAVPHGTDSQITAWDLAYAVGARLHMTVMGISTHPANLQGIARATIGFGDDLDACEIDLVQPVCLPTLMAADAGDWTTRPSAIWLSYEPYTGPPNLPLYVKVSEVP